MSSTVKKEFQLTDHQREIGEGLVESVGKNTVTALAGYAGVGKTFMQDWIARHCKRPVHATATTHKAATVLAEKLRGMDVTTIHSLLGVRPDPESQSGFVKIPDAKSKISHRSLIMVDETSMANEELLDELYRQASVADAHILLIGDPAQLPPVLAAGGVVFIDWTRKKSGDDAIFTLTQIVRQSAGSAVPLVAALYREKRETFELPIKPIIRDEGSVLIADHDKAVAEYVERAPNHVTDEDEVYLSFTNARVEQVNQMCRIQMYGDRARTEPFIKGETVISFSTIYTDNGTRLLHNQQTARIQSVMSKIIPNEVGGDPIVGYEVELEPSLGGGGVGPTVKCTTADFPTRALMLKSSTAKATRLQNQFKAQIKAIGLSSAWHQEHPKSRSNFMAFLRKHGAPLGLADLDDDRRGAWRDHYKLAESIVDLRGRFALTIHKSQGSTYRDVLLDTSAFWTPGGASMRVPLMYTGLTRCSRNVTILTDGGAEQ